MPHDKFQQNRSTNDRNIAVYVIPIWPPLPSWICSSHSRCSDFSPRFCGQQLLPNFCEDMLIYEGITVQNVQCKMAAAAIFNFVRSSTKNVYFVGYANLPQKVNFEPNRCINDRNIALYVITIWPPPPSWIFIFHFRCSDFSLKLDGRQLVLNFCGNRLIYNGIIADYMKFKMAAAAILNFVQDSAWNAYLVGHANMLPHVKFQQNRSINDRDIVVCVIPLWPPPPS